MIDLQYASEEVKTAHKNLEEAKLSFNRTILQAQSECSHPQVLETGWRTGGWQAERVCRVCGFHEYGGYGSATTKHSGVWESTNGLEGRWYGTRANTKLTTEFAKQVTPQEIRQYQTHIKE